MRSAAAEAARRSVTIGGGGVSKMSAAAAAALGNRRCYGNHFAPHTLGCRSHVGFQE